MTGVLRSVIVFAICGVEDSSQLSALAGANLIKEYVAGVGKFGQTPFLYPLYGCSEIAQAFCRVAAVHGAMYMLRIGVSSVQLEDGKCVGLTDSGILIIYFLFDFLNEFSFKEGSKWNCDFLVASPSQISAFETEPASKGAEYRACCLIKGSATESELSRTTQVMEGGHIVQGIHLDSSMKVCPEGFHVVYLWSSTDVLEAAVASLGEVEWVVFYSLEGRKTTTGCSNVFVTKDPLNGDLDYAASIEEAKELFQQISGLPQEEFFVKKE